MSCANALPCPASMRFLLIRKLIDGYHTTFSITRGFLIALSGSLYLYSAWLDITLLPFNTLAGILFFFLLLRAPERDWFWSGTFIAAMWFWWIPLSFEKYGFGWALPIGVVIISIIYGAIFYGPAYLGRRLEERSSLNAVWIKAIFLVTASYLHPLGFDWFKPELVFIQSFVGVAKWQFTLVLLSISLAIVTRRKLWLLALLLAVELPPAPSTPPADDIDIVTTYTPIDVKWEPVNLIPTYEAAFEQIERSIANGKRIVIFPESIITDFLNRDEMMLTRFKELSHHITVVIGALKESQGIPYNSAYLFENGQVTIADKVVLVPFGERNPLPDWLSDIVNDIFFDGAVDYQASSGFTDFDIDGTRYRSAICYEATSGVFYEDRPANLIAISNNGWFTPSIEPTQQRLLLLYYNRLYGTTIYHSINMSQSYIIKDGVTYWR